MKRPAPCHVHVTHNLEVYPPPSRPPPPHAAALVSPCRCWSWRTRRPTLSTSQQTYCHRCGRGGQECRGQGGQAEECTWQQTCQKCVRGAIYSLPAPQHIPPPSQAEHGPDSQVVLVALPGVDLSAVQAEVERQCDALPRNDTARKALAHSYAVRVPSVAEAIKFSNMWVCHTSHTDIVQTCRSATLILLRLYAHTSIIR